MPEHSERRLTIGAAHDIMQDHRRCSLDSCAEKRQAYQTLVDHGVVVPDRRAERYLR
ncbi:hypothetical protein [Nocardia cyriacigeorgica]|uniref:hypothetical protein n=1 Tax=Nocardia cyriacigeorgica TaxID=135487 RepID=UPI0014862CE8|nr:hypothetical protein [Nocardia cyriacigeorgica]